MGKQFWMVRAGEASVLFDEFKQRSYVAIGWNELGDISAATTLEKIRELYSVAHPADSPQKVAMAAGMIHRFRSLIKTGHSVVTYSQESREYLVGVVEGEYRYDQSQTYHHVRSVKWTGTVARDILSVSTRNSLGSIASLFSVSDDAAEEMSAALKGRVPDKPEPVEEKEELVQLRDDVVGRAKELIADRIISLSPEELEQLAAALLRAMGFKARVTPKGPDRGVDVIASRDGLGLEDPRIKVEVKHRPGTAMGAPEVRSFTGGLRQGDKALYISTGGFTKEAKYEADRSNVPLTLVTLDDLTELVISHYESFDMDARILLPLVKTYWPAE